MSRGASTGLRAFTLVELMLSASILAMGMVLVARGLLTANSTLQTVENRITAYMFLDEKLMALQQEAMEQGGLGPTHDAGETDFSGRPVSWTLDVEPVSVTVTGLPVDPSDVPEEQMGSIVGLTPEEAAATTGVDAAAGPEAPEVSFAQVKLRAAWQESNRAMDAELITYVGYRAPPGAPQEGVENPS